MEASLAELEQVEDVGSVVARSIHTFFRQPKNLELIKELQGAGVEIEQEKGFAGAPLEGKTFVFTGTLQEFRRDEAEKLVQSLGGRTSSSVSKQTDCVVAGENPGNKLNKAKELGLEIWSEEDFREKIGSLESR